jgi:hypothetical protein
VCAPARLAAPIRAMAFSVAARPIYETLLARLSAGKGCIMKITNLGKADGLPPVARTAVVEKLDVRLAYPADEARRLRSTNQNWLLCARRTAIRRDYGPRRVGV